MSNLFRFLFISLTLSFSAYAGNETNGGSRGGGDVYSAEVFSIARGIGKKLRAWTASGILELTDAQLAQVEAIVDLSPTPNPSAPLLEVYSFDRVYKHPELLPSRAADETALINIYDHKPPRIEVGRILWDGLRGRGIEKEMIILHELLGAAGILKNGRRVDDQFEISYGLKLRSFADWEEFRDEARTTIMILFSVSKIQMKRDRGVFVQAAEQIRKLPQYDRVMNLAGYGKKGKRKIRKLLYQDGLETSIWINSSISLLNSSGNLLSERITSLQYQRIEDWNKISKRYPDAWSSWANEILNRYVLTYTTVVGLQREYYGNAAVTQRLNAYCGGDFTQVPTAGFVFNATNFLSMGLSENIDSVEGEWERALEKNIVHTLYSLSTPITPDDLPKSFRQD